MDWKYAVHFPLSMLKPRYNLMSVQLNPCTKVLWTVLLKQLEVMGFLVSTEVLVHCCMVQYQKHLLGES